MKIRTIKNPYKSVQKHTQKIFVQIQKSRALMLSRKKMKEML